MSIATGAELTAAETIRSGFRHSPELAVGLRLTTVYALIASVGQVVVPSPCSRRSTAPSAPRTRWSSPGWRR